MSSDNLARARAWIEQALTNEGALYREGGKPYLSGSGASILDACAAVLVAAVRAKGEEMADLARDLTDNERCWLALDRHVADVPEAPRARQT